MFVKGKCSTTGLNLYLVFYLQNVTDLRIDHMKMFIEYFIEKRNNDTNDFKIAIYDPSLNKSWINIWPNNSLNEILESVDDLRKLQSQKAFLKKSQNLLYAIDKTLAKEPLALEPFIMVWFTGCFGNCEQTRVTFDEMATSFNEEQLLTFLYKSTTDSSEIITYTYYYIIVLIDFKAANIFDIAHHLDYNICNQCPDGWIPYLNEKHRRSSCYFLKKRNIVWKKTLETCKRMNARPPSVETNDELLFIKELFYKNLSNSDLDHARKLKAFIGLMRQRHSTGTRLLWSTLRPYSIRCDIIGYKDSSNNLNGFLLSFSFNEADNKTMISDACKIKVRSRSKIANVILCEKETEETYAQTMNSFQTIKQEHVKKMINTDKVIRVNSSFFQANMKLDKKNVSAEPYFNLLFDCGDDVTLLPYNLVCDDEIDCEDGRDEQYCFRYPPEQKKKLFFCKNPNVKELFQAKFSIPKRAFCDGISDCPDNSDELHCKDCLDATCEDGTCVPKIWLSREGEVCSLNTSDNIHFYLNASLDIDHLLAESESMHEVVYCDAGANKSLASAEWAPRCIYLRGRDKNPIGCSDKTHLSDCDTFMCPYGYFKCPNSYCIAAHFIKDGFLDCPYGEDESSLIRLLTTNGQNVISDSLIPPDYFACKDSTIILHPMNVCDGTKDCPRGEDEILCNVTCPLGYRCFAGAVGVETIYKSNFSSLNIFDINTKFLNLSHLNLSIVNIPYILPNLLSFHAAFSNLVTIDDLFVKNALIVSLYSLNFSGNKIFEIKPQGLLQHLPNLRYLDLSRNRNLSTLHGESIHSKKLQWLDISYTKISELDLIIFKRNPSPLRHLNLQGTRIAKVGSINRLDFFDIRDTSLTRESVFNVLKGITITSDLFTDDFIYCCPQVVGKGIPKHTCHAPEDAFSTCSDLMGDSFKRSLLWIVAVISLVGNFGVIVYRLFSDDSAIKTGYVIFVVNLAIADLLMAVYLVIIASMDEVYRGNYVMYEKAWRESLLCTAAGVISTMSNESSIIFVFLITLDRLLIIRFPYGNYRFSKPTVIASVVMAWLLSCGLSLAPAFFPNWGLYSSNAICMGLPKGSKDDGMLFGITVYIGFNCLLFLLITAGQVVIFHTLFSNKTITHKSTARRAQDFKVARQLFLVAFTNFILWFPLCVVGLLAITGHKVSNEILSWLVVVVLPVNSAVNPLLYSAPHLYANWQAFKLRTTNTGIEMKEIREPVEPNDKLSVADKAPSGGSKIEVIN